MTYKRKNTYVRSGVVDNNNSKNTKENVKNHGKNIGLLALGLVGVLLIKGMIMSTDDNFVKSTIASPMITDMQWGITGDTYRPDKTPSPELVAEVTELRRQIGLLKKGEINLASRGSVDRETTTKETKGTRFDFSKLFGNSAILAAIESECAKHAKGDVNKEFFEVIYSIVTYESHFDPNIVVISPTEHSIGLLQVNTYTNAPKGVNIEKFRKNLKDPRFNLDYQLDELYDFYVLGKQKGYLGKGLACFVAKYGQRPNWTNAKTRKYITTSIYNTFEQLEKARTN